eukprot:gene22757-28916_t
MKELEASLRAKVKELTSIIDTRNSTDFLVNRQLAEMKQSLSESGNKINLLEHDLRVISDAKVVCDERLSMGEEQWKATQIECSRLRSELSAANELLHETQIQRQKEEVRLLVAQTEARHLERKSESQAKELLRLREATENRNKLSLHYQDLSEQTSERLVRPLAWWPAFAKSVPVTNKTPRTQPSAPPSSTAGLFDWADKLRSHAPCELVTNRKLTAAQQWTLALATVVTGIYWLAERFVFLPQ